MTAKIGSMSLRDRPTTIFLPPLFAIATLLVMACSSSGTPPPTVEVVKVNTIGFVTMTHQVHFAPGSATFSIDESRALSDFIARVALDYGDQVTISARPANGASALDTLSAQRAASVAIEMRRTHLVEIQVRPSNANVESLPDAVAISVGRYVVTGPKCSDRSKPDAADDADMPAGNYGCATATNLGAMVANPADLIRGTPAGAADADFVARGVQRYRNGELSKSLQPELSKGAMGAAGTGGGGN